MTKHVSGICSKMDLASSPARPGCALVSVGICVYLHVSLLRYDLVCVHVTSLFLVGFIFVFSLV